MFGDLNRSEILGNITGDVQLRSTGTGKSVASFSVATNRRYQDTDGTWKDQADFHNVVIWGKQAEMLADRARKGTRVFVAGRLQTRSWDDKDGKKQYKTEIVCDNIILIDRYEKGPGKPAGESFSSEPTKASDNATIDPDDLPF